MRNIENMVKLVPPEKLVMGIANYGYDWPAKSKSDPHPVAQAVTFQQGVVTAVESESDIVFDPDSFNPHYSYEDENNQVHNVWMLDGVTAYNELRAAERAGVAARRCGGWAWKIRRSGTSGTRRTRTTRLATNSTEVPPGYDLILEGDGDIWRITATPQSGRRTFDYDADSDSFDDESFQSYPAVLANPADGRRAARKSRSPSTTAPIREWTPKILDVLKQKRRRQHFS